MDFKEMDFKDMYLSKLKLWKWSFRKNYDAFN